MSPPFTRNRFADGIILTIVRTIGHNQRRQARAARLAQLPPLLATKNQSQAARALGIHKGTVSRYVKLLRKGEG